MACVHASNQERDAGNLHLQGLGMPWQGQAGGLCLVQIGQVCELGCFRKKGSFCRCSICKVTVFQPCTKISAIL